MARVRNVEENEVPEDLKELYKRFGEDYGLFSNQVKVIAHSLPALRHLPVMIMEMIETAVVPRRYIEIAVVTVSKMNECRYCVSHHAPLLISEGLSPETLLKILDEDCPDLDPVDRLVRDYAVQVTNSSRYIKDNFFEQLKAYFNDAQIVELTLRTALAGFFNRFNEALRIDIEDGVMAQVMTSGIEADQLPE